MLCKLQPIVPTVSSDAEEVAELNLQYMLLAQRLLRADFATGMYRLGLTEDFAEKIKSLSLNNLVKLASSGLFLCRPSLGATEIVMAVGGNAKPDYLIQAHAAILIGSKNQEVAQEASTVQLARPRRADAHTETRVMRRELAVS